MVRLWNCHGHVVEFRDAETAKLRCKYAGESGTEGVSLWRLDGIIYFCDSLCD